VEALEKLGDSLLAMVAAQQLHEPDRGPVLVRETDHVSTRRATDQHHVDGALEALFFGHRAASCLKRAEIGGQRRFSTQADLIILKLAVFL
jgi:hypothetical protein